MIMINFTLFKLKWDLLFSSIFIGLLAALHMTTHLSGLAASSLSDQNRTLMLLDLKTLGKRYEIKEYQNPIAERCKTLKG